VPSGSSSPAAVPHAKTVRRRSKAENVQLVQSEPRDSTPLSGSGNVGPAAGGTAPSTVLNLPNSSVSKHTAIVPRGTLKKPMVNSGSSSVPIKKQSKLAQTSSVSSDEHEVAVAEPAFTFVSTVGMEKKRGRKSALVQDLELKHEQLLKRRKLLQDSASSLEKLKKIQMTLEDKATLCDRVAVLDFVGMKVVVDIIARGMNRHDILNEVEVDMDINGIDNGVLREIQAFLDNSTVIAALGTLRNVEEELAEVEAQIVDIRYHKVS
jgi:Bromodomain extra-terminal - transcription regulation